jgi:hypothetical protein
VVASFATLNSIFWLQPSYVLDCKNILFTGKKLIFKFDVSADEDATMREAIKIVFDKSQHRNCRWHIIRMWDYELEELYKVHKDKNLKEKLESLINYPLGPT